MSRLASQFLRQVGLLTVVLAAAIPSAAESETHHEFPIHYLSVFLGAATERGHDESGVAVGLEYQYRFQERWGIGGVIEVVGQETLRDLLLLVPISYHFSNFRLVTGPGIEFGEDHDELLLRLGLGYEYLTPFGLVIAPEVNIDGIRANKSTLVYGVAFGLEF